MEKLSEVSLGLHREAKIKFGQQLPTSGRAFRAAQPKSAGEPPGGLLPRRRGRVLGAGRGREGAASSLARLFGKMHFRCEICQNLQMFCQIRRRAFEKSANKIEYVQSSEPYYRSSCTTRTALQNMLLIARIFFDPAKNESSQISY